MTRSDITLKIKAKQIFLTIKMYFRFYLNWLYINPKNNYSIFNNFTYIQFLLFYVIFFIYPLLVSMIGPKFNPFLRPA